MSLQNGLSDQPVFPLQTLTQLDPPLGQLIVRGGRKRNCVRQPVSGKVSLTVDGAAGWQTARVVYETGAERVSVHSCLASRAYIHKSNGASRDPLDRFPSAISDDRMRRPIRCPASNRYAACRYRLDDSAPRVTVTFAGVGERVRLRLPLPESATSIKKAAVDGAPDVDQITIIKTSRCPELDQPRVILLALKAAFFWRSAPVSCCQS